MKNKYNFLYSDEDINDIRIVIQELNEWILDKFDELEEKRPDTENSRKICAAILILGFRVAFKKTHSQEMALSFINEILQETWKSHLYLEENTETEI